MRLQLVGLLLHLMACSAQAGLDAGPDASSAPLDGGRAQGSGCVSPDGNKFILEMQAIVLPSTVLCGMVVFRRADGGQTSSFPGLLGPDDYVPVEGRYSSDCTFEKPSGELDTSGTAPLSTVEGTVAFVGRLSNGRPISFTLDGVVRMSQFEFRLDEPLAGCNATCRGN